MRILSARAHGYIDYAVVALLLLAPSLFAFGGVAATICYVAAIAHLALSLLTRYPLGIAKVVPFPVHGAIELAVGIALVAMPWLFNFHFVENARNFFVIAGISVGVVWLLTNYQSVPTTTGIGPRRV